MIRILAVLLVLTACVAQTQPQVPEPVQTPTPALTATPQKETPTATPAKLSQSSLPWAGKHKDSVKWTHDLVELISASKLPDVYATDVIAMRPEYATADRTRRVWFWAHVISKMTQFESSFNPGATFVEGFNDQTGKPVVSRGLLQLSFESVKSYGFPLGKPEDLHDARTNLAAGIRIMERWVVRDGVLRGGKTKAWKGGARYWSVLRDHSKSKPKILAHLATISF